MKVFVLLLVAFALLIITVKSYHDNWGLALGIDKNGVIVADNIPVKSYTRGFTGISITKIDVDVKHPGHVIVNDSFVTNNHGKTWKRLESTKNLWIDGVLIRVPDLIDHFPNHFLVYSKDMGSTWSKLKFNNTYGSISIQRSAQGKIWITHDTYDKDSKNVSYHHLITSTQGELKIGPPKLVPVDFLRHIDTTISVAGAKLHGRAYKAPDGLWAATIRGPFFKATGSKQWEARHGDLNYASIIKIIPSPTNKKESIAWGKGGRLWISKNLGKSWQIISTQYVQIANYLSDGSIVIGHPDLSISIFRNHKLVKSISSSKYFKETINSRTKTDRDADKFKIFSLNGTGKQLWVVAGNPYLFFPSVGFSSNTQPKGYLKKINKILRANRGDERERDHFALFIYEPSTGWHTEPLEKLKNLESNGSKPQCKLERTDSSKRAHQDRKLYINKNIVSTTLLKGDVIRAGWLKGGSMFYALSHSRILVGEIVNCSLSGTLVGWKLESPVMGTGSAVFETSTGFTVLSPSAGVDSFHIEYSSPPIWRWIFYYLSFGPGIFIVWILFMIWAWRSYQSSKPINFNSTTSVVTIFGGIFLLLFTLYILKISG